MAHPPFFNGISQITPPVLPPQLQFNPTHVWTNTTPTIDPECDTKPDITEILANITNAQNNVQASNDNDEWMDVRQLQLFSPDDDVTLRQESETNKKPKPQDKKTFSGKQQTDVSHTKPTQTHSKEKGKENDGHALEEKTTNSKKKEVEESSVTRRGRKNGSKVVHRRKKKRKRITSLSEDSENEDSDEEWAEEQENEDYSDDTDFETGKNKKRRLPKRQPKKQIGKNTRVLLESNDNQAPSAGKRKRRQRTTVSFEDSEDEDSGEEWMDETCNSRSGRRKIATKKKEASSKDTRARKISDKPSIGEKKSVTASQTNNEKPEKNSKNLNTQEAKADEINNQLEEHDDQTEKIAASQSKNPQDDKIAGSEQSEEQSKEADATANQQLRTNEDEAATTGKRKRKQITTLSFEDSDKEPFEDSGDEWVQANEERDSEEETDNSEEIDNDLSTTTNTQQSTYTCRLCNFETEKKLVLIQHYWSQEHKEKEESVKTDCRLKSGDTVADDDVVEEKIEVEEAVCGGRTEENARNSYLCVQKAGSIVWYKCDLCNFKTRMKNSLHFHLQTKEHKKAVRQPPENEDETNPRKKKSRKLYRCRYCNFITKAEVTIYRHILNAHCPAENVRWYYCDPCNFKAKGEHKLQRHYLTNQHIDAMNTIKRAEKLHSMKNAIKEEFSSSGKFKWFVCETCNFKTRMADSIQFHMRSKEHLDAVGGQDEQDPEKNVDTATENTDKSGTTSKLKCNICGIVTKSADNLRAHIVYKHSPFSTYECKVCAFKTGMKMAFQLHLLGKKHVRMVSDHELLERTRLCEQVIAGSDASEQQGLNSEDGVGCETAYTKQKQRKCDDCDYATKSKVDLLVHTMDVHTLNADSRRYDCTICNVKIWVKSSFQYHILSSRHKEAVTAAREKELYRLLARNDTGETVIEEKIEVEEDRLKTEDEEESGADKERSDYLHVNDEVFLKGIEVIEENEADEDGDVKIVEEVVPVVPPKVNCGHCDFAAASESELQGHIREKHSVKKTQWYNCYQCNFRTRMLDSYELHTSSHHREEEVKNVKQEAADEAEDWADIDVEEDVSEHESEDKDDEEEETKAKFKCEHCKYKTDWKNNMTKHVISRHTARDDIQWFDCAHCPYKAKTKEYLFKHWQFAHNKMESLKWLYCDQCTYKTKLNSHLKHHVVVNHTKLEDIQWWACDECPKRYKTKRFLNGHLKTHHRGGEKKWFYCDKCHYRATTPKQVRQHLEAHDSLKKWFRCKECPYQSCRFGELESHVRTLHKFEDLDFELSDSPKSRSPCGKSECFERVDVNGVEVVKCKFCSFVSDGLEDDVVKHVGEGHNLIKLV